MPSPNILVVDDERSMRELLEITLRQAGYSVTVADGGESALEILKGTTFDLVITDLRMRTVGGLDVLRAVKEHAPDTVVLVVTAYASTETAVEAMRLGAYDYITKPFKLDEIKLTAANALERKRLQEENRALKRELRRERGLPSFVGRSRRMLELFDIIRKTADSTSNVLITGESGTGKELVARAIHEESERRAGPFVSVNSGAIPEGLLESELFGHVKGSFTGAVANTEGLFAAADGGTLFLDEVTEIPVSVQVKLLRAIQEREIRRVGGTEDVPVDVRLIAASNRNVEKAVDDGTLRGDLFYRLNVIPIQVPPLRERREDIPLLVAHFIQKVARETGKAVRGVTPEALAVLEQYRWPGNIRELENVVERAIVLGGGDTIGLDALPPGLMSKTPASLLGVEIPHDGLDMEAMIEDLERRYIQLALERTGGNQTRAADILGLTFRQFRYKLQKHAARLSPPPDPAAPPSA
ncbi:MAG: sigma-54-dependent Fis family transcriptional regulator [Candidatus Rokubacteria bacterium]|nr:sigma-54-dependent Fis family transcriptional regulator [Candidatus Rokubacteria bacterium]